MLNVTLPTEDCYHYDYCNIEYNGLKEDQGVYFYNHDNGKIDQVVFHMIDQVVINMIIIFLLVIYCIIVTIIATSGPSFISI